jgi:Tol biopolymer transport system component
MKRRFIVLTLLMFACLASTPAQQKRPMDFDDVMALKSISDPQVSPDGHWIAYVVTTADMKQDAADPDIWLISTEGGDPLRLTTSEKRDTSPRWSPDGKHIAFISTRDEKTQIFIISPLGGEADKLTDSKTGVQSVEWSPDGRRIAYTSQQELTPEEEKKQKDRDDTQVVDKDFKMSRLWVIDVQTRKATELVKENYMVQDPQWSPDGRHIAYTAVPTPKADDLNLSDIWLVEVESGKVLKLTDNPGTDTSARWSPDGKRVAYLSRDVNNGVLGQLKLTVMPTNGGAPKEVAPGFLYQPGAPTWSADGGTLFFVAQVRTTSQLFSVPAAGGDPKQLSRIAGTMTQASFSRDGSTIAFAQSDVQHPAEVCVAKPSSMLAPVQLTRQNPQVEKLALGSDETIRWKAKDGMEIDGLMIYPSAISGVSVTLWWSTFTVARLAPGLTAFPAGGLTSAMFGLEKDGPAFTRI